MALRIKIEWNYNSKFLQILEGKFTVHFEDVEENHTLKPLLNGKIRKEKYKCSINMATDEESLKTFYEIRERLMTMIDSYYEGFILSKKHEKWFSVLQGDIIEL